MIGLRPDRLNSYGFLPESATRNRPVYMPIMFVGLAPWVIAVLRPTAAMPLDPSMKRPNPVTVRPAGGRGACFKDVYFLRLQGAPSVFQAGPRQAATPLR